MKFLMLLCAFAPGLSFAADPFANLLTDPAQIEAVTEAYLSGTRPKAAPRDVNPALAIYRGVRAVSVATHPALNSASVIAALGRLNAFATRGSALEAFGRRQFWIRFPRVHEDSKLYSSDLAALLVVDDGRLLPRGILALQNVARAGATPEVRAMAAAAIQSTIDVLAQIAGRTGEFASTGFSNGKQEAVAARMIRQLGGGRNVDLGWFTLDSDQAISATVRAYFLIERPPGARDDDNPVLRIAQYVDEFGWGDEAASHRVGELLSSFGLLLKFAVRNEIRGVAHKAGARDLAFLVEGVNPGHLSAPASTLARLARDGGTAAIRMRAEMTSFELAHFAIEMVTDLPAQKSAWLRFATDLLQAVGTRSARQALLTLSEGDAVDLGAAARATLSASCGLHFAVAGDAGVDP